MVVNWFNSTFIIKSKSEFNAISLSRFGHLHGAKKLAYYLRSRNIPQIASLLVRINIFLKLLGYILKRFRFHILYVYVVHKNKSINLALIISFNGKKLIVQIHNNKLLVETSTVRLLKKPTYEVDKSLHILFELLSKSERDYLEKHVKREISDEITQNVDYIRETSIARYLWVEPGDYDFIKDGCKYYRKSKLKKLRSKDAWLTQFGRVIKVSWKMNFI